MAFGSARDRSDMAPGDRIIVTNYQRLLGGHFDANQYGAVVLDESSILKSYMGKTKQLLCDVFHRTPFKLCCTATPSPNDHMELGNHSQFLGVMDSDEMLSRWFINDQSESGKYRLKGHAEADYWRWVASWAVCPRPSQRPRVFRRRLCPAGPATCMNTSSAAISDRGRWRQSLPHGQTDGDGTAQGDATNSILPRRGRCAELINASKETWIVWCNTNYEADEIRPLIKGSVEVRGSDKDEVKERRLSEFSDGKTRVLVTKPSVAGFGMNWQHWPPPSPSSVCPTLKSSSTRRSGVAGGSARLKRSTAISSSAMGRGKFWRRSNARKNRLPRCKKLMRRAASKENNLGQDNGRLELIEVEHDIESGTNWAVSCVVIAFTETKKIPNDTVDISIFSPAVRRPVHLQRGRGGHGKFGQR